MAVLSGKFRDTIKRLPSLGAMGIESQGTIEYERPSYMQQFHNVINQFRRQIYTQVSKKVTSWEFRK